MKKKTPNYSIEHRLFLKSIRRKKILILISQISLFLGILLIWELLTAFKIMDPFFMSSPSRIVKTIIDLFKTGDIFTHIGITVYETILGFILATVLGTFFAILLWASETLRKILDPFIVVLNSLPKIALGPIIIIWFGTGTKSIVFMCILICIVITTLSMLNSFLNCDKDKILLMKSMKANKFQILTKLILPNSLSEFISVLKINVGMSWVGTIMGEYLASKAGLGYLIVYGGQVFKIDLVMASTVILCILAGIMYFIVSKIESRFKKHYD